jgi:glycerophosphoryl diester phosphodiesterase
MTSRGPTPKITARAGLSDQFPENTLPAFRQALDHGADRLEMDVHWTLDRQLVLHHFYQLGKTDNGVGLTFRQDRVRP